LDTTSSSTVKKSGKMFKSSYRKFLDLFKLPFYVCSNIFDTMHLCMMMMMVFVCLEFMAKQKLLGIEKAMKIRKIQSKNIHLDIEIEAPILSK
jgi:hypothetical protein